MLTKQNGIWHLKTAPYHPLANSLAERAVQVFKWAMKKGGAGELTNKLARFLLHYRMTSQATTGMTPVELLMGHSPPTHLDKLRSNISARVECKQLSQKLYNDDRSRECSFLLQEKVHVWEAGNNFSSDCQGDWVETEKCSLQKKLDDGRLVKRHIDHIQPCTSTSIPTDAPETQQDEDMFNQIDIPSSSNPTSPTTPLNKSSTQEVPINQELPRRFQRI